MALSSKEYWEKRSLERLTEAERASIPYIRKVRKIYEDSARSITKSVKKMYAAYYRRQENDGTGRFDSTKLNEIIPPGDIKRFQKAMRAAGLSTRLPSYYKGRMTRAKLLEAQIWAEIQKAAENEQELSTQSYKNTISNSYYRSIYDYSKLTSSDQAFSKLNDRSMNRILNSKLAGDDYSSRIWKSSDKLADSIKNIMGKAIATGQPLEKTTRNVMQRFDVKKYEAERLIRTETNYFENYAEIESYEEMGIDHFIFMATLDGRTSEICREMDGKIFKVKDARQGDNVPPLHPYCRSTIAPYLGKEYAPTERRARGMQEDSKTQIVKFQSFQSWAKEKEIYKTKNGEDRYEKALFKDKKFISYAKKLGAREDPISQEVSKIMMDGHTSALVAELNIKDTDKYNRFLEGRKNGFIRLTINSNAIRHMFKRGHLTGIAIVGKDDQNPLSISDWSKLKKVFIDPDSVRLNKGKIQIDKWFKGKHLRLIVTKSKDIRRASVVTFFNRIK